MKCPMKFSNPCADVDESCEGEECMWYVAINGMKSCAVAFSAASLASTCMCRRRVCGDEMNKQWCSCNSLRDAQEKAAKWDEVVHCVECKHWATENRYTFKCLGKDGKPVPNGFCAWGERRES